MKVAVILRQVPDVVEELVIAEDGRSLSEDDVMCVTNELDDHALEQALIMKGKQGARVTAICVGGSETRDALATSVAKGADEAISVAIEFKDRGDNHKLALHLADTLKTGGFDLILSGMQAVDEIDGSLGGILATHLGRPYAGGLTGVEIAAGGGKVTVKKAYSGGRTGVMDIVIPAVLGIQSAEQPPRYVPVNKVMQTKKTLQVKEIKTPVPGVTGLHVSQLSKPETGAKAKMIEGDEEAVATSIAGLLKERGLL